MSAVGAIPSAQPKAPQVEDKAVNEHGDMNGINRPSAIAKRTNRVERMRQFFAEQPKEEIKIRKELGEQFVQINGYPFQIQAGVRVKVPRDVAELLRNAEII